MKNRLAFCIGLIFFQTELLFAQSSASSGVNEISSVVKKRRIKDAARPYLFQYGIAGAFIAGLYEGQLSIDTLKKQGNFGIGAPNLIDGELTIVDGKAYQSNAQGITRPAPGNLRTPFAFVTNFTADTLVLLSNVQNIGALFKDLEAALPKRNGMYAIRIKGEFLEMKTRAFPPMTTKPYKPLDQLLDKQNFFEWNDIQGEMIGFYMPGYLAGINITGLHFHFLSQNRKSGGHVVGLTAKNLVVEIGELNDFRLQHLDTNEFQNFKFSGGNSVELQQIEKGGH